MDITAFLVSFPEFRDVDPGLVQSALDSAARFCAADVYRAQLDDAVSLYAADMLTTSPLGGATRLQADPSKTSTYRQAFNDLRDVCGVGWFLVAGGR